MEDTIIKDNTFTLIQNHWYREELEWKHGARDCQKIAVKWVLLGKKDPASVRIVDFMTAKRNSALKQEKIKIWNYLMFNY